MALTQSPIARTQMLIRRPIGEVFEAFIEPALTSRFWFSRGSGRLVPGAEVVWHWDDYGVSAQVRVEAVEPNRRIVISWPTPVEWTFDERPLGTLIVIVASGFAGTADEQVAAALDSMGGFSLLLAGCKAYLEHGLALNLVPDHHPDAHADTHKLSVKAT